MSTGEESMQAQRIEAACLAMEQATDAATRTAADTFLQAFRTTPRPYALCTMLLQGSAVASAQFAALATIKAAIHREGRVLGGAFLAQLKDQLLNCLILRAHTWSRFVLNQCIHVISILFKWICIDSDEARLKAQKLSKTSTDERPAYIDMANCVASLLQRNTAPADASSPSSATFFSLLALELSKSLIAEFTQGTSHSNAGVSVSMHVRCHSSFEQHVLFNLANLILTQSLPTTLHGITAAASSAAGALSAPLIDGLNVLHSLLSFVDALLQFQFEDPKHPDALAMKWALSSSSGDRPADEPVAIKPSAKWAPILVHSQLVEMVTHAYTMLSTLAQQVPNLSTAFSKLPESLHLARTCLLHLASIHGAILADPVPEPVSVVSAPLVRPFGPSQTSLSFLARIIVAINSLMERSLTTARATPPQGDRVPLSEETGHELIGFASVVKRVLWPGSFHLLYVLPDPSQLPKLLNLHHALSLLLIPHIVSTRLHGVKVVHTDTSKAECFDLCLDNWSTIIYELINTPPEVATAQQLLALVRQCTGSIFETYVQLRMRSQLAPVQPSAAADEDDDEDEDEGQFMESSYVDHHLSDVAALGKLHAQASLKLITGELNGVLARWQQVVTQSQAGPTNATSSLYSIHEAFYFLLRLLGHVISSGELTWKDMDSSQRYCAIPRHMLDMLRQDADGSGITALRTTIETVINIATFTNQLLDHKPAGGPVAISASVLATQSLKEFCSPLVFESLVWLLQQFVATGYFLIDQGRYEAVSSDTELPVSLLQLYSGGNKVGQQAVYGSAASPILAALVQTCVALISHYNEEASLMELTMELLELCARHVPMRLLFKQQLLSPASSQFKQFFLVTFMSLFTTDPYQLLHANNSQLLVQFQSQQSFYNLSPEMIMQVADILIQCLTFRVEDDCNDIPPGNKQAAQAEKAQRRQQSLQALQGLLVPLSQGFFGLLMHPQFQQLKSSLLLKFLTNYVSLFTGVVRELFVDNFDFLWHWITATDSMMQLPTTQPNIEAMVAQLGTVAQQAEVQIMRAGAGGGAAAVSKQNLLTTFTDVIRQYNTDEVIAHATDTGASLQLFSAILLFYRKFTECFLPYLNQAQSYRLLQAILALVNVFISLMERRTSAAALALRAQQHANHKQEALRADMSLMESAEWDILHSLLQLLECVGGKDHVDLSTDSVDFASDAVLNGLMLLIPRLTGNMLSRPKIAALFFNLLSSLVSTNPDKLASVLNEHQRNQLLQVIEFVFESEAPLKADPTATTNGSRSVLAVSTSSQLLREACAAVQAISQYHLYFVSGKAEVERAEAAQAMQRAMLASATKRAMPTQAPPPPSPFAAACASFLRSLLRVLLRAHLTPDLLDPLADAMLPTILAQPAFFMEHVRELLDSWKQAHRDTLQRVQQTLGDAAAAARQVQLESVHAAVEAGFQRLIPSGVAQSGVTGAASRTYMSSKTMAVERSQRMLFRQQVREFVLSVRPLIASSEQ